MTRRTEIPSDALPPPPGLTIAIEPRRDAVWLVPRGEIDLATVGQLKRELGELVDAGFARVVIDLRGVEFMDSAGLHALLSAYSDAQRDGWELSLIPGPRAVQRVFEITGTIDRLRFHAVNRHGAAPTT